MDKIVMTLLVRRVPEENAKYPFAVQISLPRELTAGASLFPTAARLINNKGIMASVSETLDFYHPHEWRAALLNEQASYAAAFNGNPKPWYCVMRSFTKDVYDYPGSGDREKNNGQVWAEIDDLDEVWSTEPKLRGKCQEELDAEWNKRVAQAIREPSSADWVQERFLTSLKARRHPNAL